MLRTKFGVTPDPQTGVPLMVVDAQFEYGRVVFPVGALEEILRGLHQANPQIYDRVGRDLVLPSAPPPLIGPDGEPLGGGAEPREAAPGGAGGE
jgi:hypothetical protein